MPDAQQSIGNCPGTAKVSTKSKIGIKQADHISLKSYQI